MSLAFTVSVIRQPRIDLQSVPSDVGPHPLDDLVGRRPGVKISRHARLFEAGDVLVGNDPAAEDGDVLGPSVPQQLDDPREEVIVRTGEDRQRDRVDVFLDCAVLTTISGVWCRPV